MNLLTDIAPGTEDNMNVIIEIPEGSRNKYEYDKKNNIFALDRPLNSKFAYPADYGFIPQTHCDDGDPLDAFVLMREPVFPGILVPARPVAVLIMEDGGEQDDKLVCVPIKDKYADKIQDKEDLPEQLLKEIKHFLEHYKDVKGGNVKITAIEGKAKAIEVFKASIELYKQQK
ncbi:inorganic diphosphatase [Candidatus Woesearchaeota archaeon]|jgi:inorganic pyrophosphatase|nr:inorganic diphosphatase [archaeon]MBT7332298.1 inorganic diphosphatase [Candidatus Woesearchaeota archaeon]